ncbi:hypothetical protein E2C01_000568 [Portunus trituberculatus]|uniref:Uncharacterized protein n=1 Tax=Portunus trituberculatus TaxID=210409 RepID=A0A5B7CEP5_PORTR|nr:hypothetical protein [Portunus trituberculatus]
MWSRKRIHRRLVTEKKEKSLQYLSFTRKRIGVFASSSCSQDRRARISLPVTRRRHSYASRRVVVDPVDEVSDLCVHAGEVRARAAVAPGGDTVLNPSANEGAAGISLAGVLTSLKHAGAEHVVSDVSNAVGCAAVRVTHHGHCHLRYGTVCQSRRHWQGYAVYLSLLAFSPHIAGDK